MSPKVEAELKEFLLEPHGEFMNWWARIRANGGNPGGTQTADKVAAVLAPIVQGWLDLRGRKQSND